MKAGINPCLCGFFIGLAINSALTSNGLGMILNGVMAGIFYYLTMLDEEAQRANKEIKIPIDIKTDSVKDKGG